MYIPFFNTTVVQEGDKIHVRNVPTRYIKQDIIRLYKTSKITNNIFVKISSSNFTVYSFFALELYYILDGLIKGRRIGVNVRLLKEIQDQLKQNTWLANIDKEVPDRLNFALLKDLHYTLLPFQLNFLHTYSKANGQYGLLGMLLAGTAGSGKTATTLAVAHCLQAERVVIVCPNNAVNIVWVDNIERVFRQVQTYWTFSSGKPYQGQRFAIFHYEALEKAHELIAELKRGTTMVILDESHNLNEIKSLRTQRFLTLCKKLESKDVVFASGTSFKAATLESIPLLRAIDPYFTPYVEERFKAVFKGEVNAATEILANRINAISFKITKQELELADPVFKEVKVVIPNGKDFTLTTLAKVMTEFITERLRYYKATQLENSRFFYQCLDNTLATMLASATSRTTQDQIRADHAVYMEDLRCIISSKMYRDVPQEIIRCNIYERLLISHLPDKATRDRFKDVKSIIKYVKLKVQGECLGRVLGRKRIEAHVAMVKHIDYEAILDSSTKKTVVFTSFVEVVNACRDHLKSIGRRPLIVYGNMESPLSSVVGEFGNNAEANPLVATYASLSTAVPLIMADTMLLINPPFRNYILEQAVSRIHRLGQTTQTVIYSTVLDTGDEPNISSRSLDILKWSQEQVEKILQIESPFKLGEDSTEETALSLEQFDAALAEEYRLFLPSLPAPHPRPITVARSPLYLQW